MRAHSLGQASPKRQRTEFESEASIHQVPNSHFNVLKLHLSMVSVSRQIYSIRDQTRTHWSLHRSGPAVYSVSCHRVGQVVVKYSIWLERILCNTRCISVGQFAHINKVYEQPKDNTASPPGRHQHFVYVLDPLLYPYHIILHSNSRWALNFPTCRQRSKT